MREHKIYIEMPALPRGANELFKQFELHMIQSGVDRLGAISTRKVVRGIAGTIGASVCRGSIRPFFLHDAAGESRPIHDRG